MEIETQGSVDCLTTRGASGEIGCHQFIPSTWKAYSLEIFGSVKEQTHENTKHVVIEKIEKWLQEGKTPRQIFLIWNQGNSGPCSKGVNSHGVRYDSCSYAQKGVDLLGLSY